MKTVAEHLKLVKADPGKNLDKKKSHDALPFNALSLIGIKILPRADVSCVLAEIFRLSANLLFQGPINE
jgi:hypothetical protein